MEGGVKMLTIGVFERLLLLGRFGNDFDAFAVEDADVLAVAVEHLHRQHEVLPFVRVGDEQRFGSTVTLFQVAISINHSSRAFQFQSISDGFSSISST